MSKFVILSLLVSLASCINTSQNSTAEYKKPVPVEHNWTQKCVQCIKNRQRLSKLNVNISQDFCRSDKIQKCCATGTNENDHECQSTQQWYYFGNTGSGEANYLLGLETFNQTEKIRESKKASADEYQQVVDQIESDKEDSEYEANQENANRVDLAVKQAYKPGEVLCSSSLAQSVSWLSQYELCDPSPTKVCGNQFIIARIAEQFFQSAQPYEVPGKQPPAPPCYQPPAPAQPAHNSTKVPAIKQNSTKPTQANTTNMNHQKSTAVPSQPKLPPKICPPAPPAKNITMHPFSTNSMCTYEISNPFPNQTLFFNIYRQTNDTEIGIFFQTSKSQTFEKASFTPLNLPIYQSKLNLTSFWTSFSSIINLEERIHTFSIDYPIVNSFFSDLDKHERQVGRPFHNLTDIVRQYRFEDVNKIKVVVTSRSEQSQFDFAVQLSLFSTYHNILVNKYWKYGAGAVAALFAMYCLYLVVTYRRKTDDRNYQDLDEEEAEVEVQEQDGENQLQ